MSMDFNAAWPVLVIVVGYLALLVLGSTFRFGVKDVLKSDYNVLFFSILVGLALVSISELIVSLFEILVPPVHGFLSHTSSYIVENLPTIRYFLPYENEQYNNTHFVSVLLVSVVLIVALRPFFNTYKKRNRIIRKHAERRGEHIACFLQDALESKMLIQLSLLNGRVYVGQIVNTPITDIEEKDADVSLQVVLSGHRHSLPGSHSPQPGRERRNSVSGRCQFCDPVGCCTRRDARLSPRTGVQFPAAGGDAPAIVVQGGAGGSGFGGQTWKRRRRKAKPGRIESGRGCWPLKTGLLSGTAGIPTHTGRVKTIR